MVEIVDRDGLGVIPRMCYQCPVCSTVYPTVEEAKRCHRGHVAPVPGRQVMVYAPGEQYPREVVMGFASGAVIRYRQETELSGFLPVRPVGR